MQALRQIDGWPVEFAAAGVVGPAGEISAHGDSTQAVRLASVSKPVTALALLIAAEEGVVDLDEPAGPPGSTVRHLLAHTSGLPFEGKEPIARPEHRRIYSNEGFRALGAHLEARAEMPFAEYVRQAVCAPLGIDLDPFGDPGSGMYASLDDVLALGKELLSPRLLADETRDEMIAVQFPGLPGVLPDYGRFDPLDWGLGVQLNTQPPTWMGTRTSAQTFGHFGGTGTFLWVDPDAGVVCAALTTREFDEWAKEAWPRLADAVLDELAAGEVSARVQATVGGNRYGWFAQNEIDDLAIDNSARTGIVSTPGCEIKINNGGKIVARNGDEATFGGNAKVSLSGVASGEQVYQDHGPVQPLTFKALTVDAVICSEARSGAELHGTGSVNGAGSFQYRITLRDQGEPGTNDVYGILIPGVGYASGDQQLQGGNVQIR